jgi:RNA polymerase sigma-70 factor (ECF subfamily)
MNNEFDLKLVNQYLRGDKESLKILIQKYLKPIFNFIFTYIGNAQDCEDITQEVFVKVWSNIWKFDKKKNFKTWIFTIAKNSAIDFLRKKKTIPFSAFDKEDGSNFILETVVDKSSSVTDYVNNQESSNLISSKLKYLSFKNQEVINLRHNRDLTFKEISKNLGESINTIKSRYRRAIVSLKKLISRYPLDF